MYTPAMWEALCLLAYQRNGMTVKELSAAGMARILYRQMGSPDDLSKVDLSELTKLAGELEDEQGTQFHPRQTAPTPKQTGARGKAGAVAALETANKQNENLRFATKKDDGKVKFTPAEQKLIDSGKLKPWELLDLINARKEHDK